MLDRLADLRYAVFDAVIAAPPFSSGGMSASKRCQLATNCPLPHFWGM
jgi:hypothetical protein